MMPPHMMYNKTGTVGLFADKILLSPITVSVKKLL